MLPVIVLAALAVLLARGDVVASAASAPAPGVIHLLPSAAKEYIWEAAVATLLAEGDVVASVTPAPRPDVVPLLPSAVDGYTTENVVRITPDGEVRMTTRNFHTAGGREVLLTNKGILITGPLILAPRHMGDGATHLEDQFLYSCSASNPEIRGSRVNYANDKYGVDLPKTRLDLAALFRHQAAVLAMQVCAGEQEPPPEGLRQEF